MMRIQSKIGKLNFLRRYSSISTQSNPVVSSSSAQVPESKTQQEINADIQVGNPVPVFKKAIINNQKVAIKDGNGEKTYYDLVSGSHKLSKQISQICEKQSLSRVAFLCPNDISYILSQWATWMSGQIAVPLSTIHPAEVLEYYISDSQANLIITTPEYEAKIRPLADKLNKPLEVIEHQKFVTPETTTGVTEDTLLADIPNGSFYKASPALIMYTSGTTSKPKGVVLSYSNLDAQIASLSHAWKIQNNDVVLHSLPLHHVHGVINALLLPLSAGGKVIMLPKFDSDVVWSYLLNVNMPQKDRVSVFMGVPTSYHYLIQEYDKLFKKSEQMSEYIKTHCQNKVRLMISGSAPLPQTIFNRWKEITGHKLLERYGMSEIGMCLSNTLHEDQVKQRLPGFVGHPLPGMQIRIINPDNESDVLLEAAGDYNKGLWSQEAEEKATMKIKPGSASDAEIIGSLQVKGPNIFTEYWKRPDATAKSFTSEGWFITGDTACYDPTVNSFKIMGRNSVDIIKSRGYKISALEIETKLLENPYIEDCAVIGIPDEILGQKIVALTVFRENKVAESSMDEIIPALKKWCESKFASYSMPSIKIMTKIPRNQMGKVNKADLVKDFTKVSATPAT